MGDSHRDLDRSSSTETICSNDASSGHDNDVEEEFDSSSTGGVVLANTPQTMTIPTTQIESSSDVQVGHRLHYHGNVVIHHNFHSAKGQNLSITEDLIQHATATQVLENKQEKVKNTVTTPEPTLYSTRTIGNKKHMCVLVIVVFIANIAVSTTISLLIVRGDHGIITEVPTNKTQWGYFKQFLDTLQKHKNKSGDWSFLPTVVTYGDPKLVELLLYFGANPDIVNTKGLAALHIAAAKDMYEMVTVLTNHGANLTIQAGDNNGDTPIHLAAESKRYRIVVLLLEKGVPVNIKNKFLDTPLHNAVLAEDLNIINLLIHNGANVNAQNKQNETALFLSAGYGTIQVSELLMKNGANLNLPNHKMETPLHYAASSGNLNLTRLLVQKGANLHARDYLNRTPFDVAESSVKDWLSKCYNEDKFTC